MYEVLTFLHKQDWKVIFQRSKHIFQVHSLPSTYPEGTNVHLLQRQFYFSQT
jgi:hypothetical protein